MTKTEKQLDKAITRALQNVCETAHFQTGPHQLRGFEWLTHFVDYSSFPSSLLIVCVFGTSEQRLHALEAGSDAYFVQLVRDKFKAEKIHVPNIKKQLRFDSEESCTQQHGGDWQARYRQTRH